MALYPIDRDPGPWLQFVKRTDVKDLNLNEQKSQFLKEQLQFQDFLSKQSIMQRQYQDYMSNQANGGGEDITNGVEQISFSTNPLNTITGFTSNLFIKFIEPVVVETNSGVNIPTVNIANDQDGAGATNPIVYSFNAGLSSGPVVGFTYTQAAAAGNNGGVAASTLATSTNFATAPTAITQPTRLTSGSFTTTGIVKGAGYTIAPDTLAQDAILTVVTSTDAFDSTSNLSITSITPTTEGFGALPGDVITFAAGALGSGFLLNLGTLTGTVNGGTLATGAGVLTATKNFTSVTAGASQAGTGGSITIVTDNAGAITSATINSVGANYVAGNVLTISAAELASTTARADGTANVDIVGAGGATDVSFAALTGGDIQASVGGAFTIAAAQLTPDILTTAGTVISENGGAIYDAGTDPADELNLDYASLAAVTLAATPA